MSDLIIRQAQIKDVKEMATLDVLCFTEPWSEDSFYKELTENKVALYLVSEIEGKVVGYAGVWLVSGEGHITNIAVSPSFRRKKIAENMVTVMINVAEEENVKMLTLEVRQSNEAAKSLYRKLGFVEVGKRKKYYADNNEDAIIMNRGESV